MTAKYLTRGFSLPASVALAGVFFLDLRRRSRPLAFVNTQMTVHVTVGRERHITQRANEWTFA